ncbi:alpha/beta hydrolase [Parvularcula lutaonensis]|nr:alpha/beta hydrolase [Parvularcula lutaonensis]
MLAAMLGMAPAHAGLFSKRVLFESVDRRETVFEPRGEEPVPAEEITLTVPENRSDRNSRMIAIRLVRLPALNPKGHPPIVYLAGGPGGSATGAARGPRWAMFDRLRQDADVILFDQRGTGLSDRPASCESTYGWADGGPAHRRDIISAYRGAFEECAAFWEASGVDLKGWNTLESAHDLAAVADVLGGEISLLGISYGTHLALATVKEYPNRIDRAVLVSVEGLDQTVKMPAHTDAYFERLQAAIDSQPEAKALYPDVAGTIRRLAARFDAEPVVIRRSNKPDLQLTGYGLRIICAFMISDPERAVDLLAALKAADETGDVSTFARILPFILEDSIDMDAMSTGMDLASGVSARRLRRVQSQARTAVLGDALNFPMPHLLEVAKDYQLPDSFRKRPRGKTPILVFSGTLDGRTYPEGARKATRGLKKNREIVLVRNGGHNLFFDHQEVVPLIDLFLDGGEVESRELEAALPNFAPVDDA